jgi:ABC-2 type transport system ATP-binding protein
VLDSVDFDLESGSVTGLAGPNGSGKTTLMKVLSGLALPSSGEVLIDGTRPNRLARTDGTVGVFLGVENLHRGRSVIETLKIAAFLAGVPSTRARERLSWSGLEAVAGRLVNGLSLGMRVRLGMALATLRDPRVLLLDEPLNGLDVDGIQWVRAVIARHVAVGGTTLLSSHLLRELEDIADRTLIMSRGVVVRDLTMTELRSNLSTIWIRVTDDASLESALSGTDWNYEAGSGGWNVRADIDDVARLAFEVGAHVLELRPAEGQRLEDVFVDSVSGEFVPSVPESSR